MNDKFLYPLIAIIILFVAAPSVLKVFSGDYPWWLRVAVPFFVLAGAAVAAMRGWPFIRGKKQSSDTKQTGASDQDKK